MKSFFLIIRINSFTEIDKKDFNKKFFLTIKKIFKKVAEFILKSKNNVNFNAYESLFHKQKGRVRLDVKIQDR